MKAIYFNKPANSFEEAFVMGNGTLGATVYGGTDMDVFELNHERFWGGAFGDKINYDAQKHMASAISLIRDKKYEEASALIRNEIVGPNSGAYLSLGTLLIKDGGFGEIKEYTRSLDLSRAVLNINYKRPILFGDVLFKTQREIFVSFPQNVLVVRYLADEGKKLTMTASLMSDFVHTIKNHNNFLHATIKAPDTRKRYKDEVADTVTGNLTLKAYVADGLVETTENSIMVTDTTDVTFIVTAETNFIAYNEFPDKKKDLVGICEKRIEDAVALGYDGLLAEHTRYYSSLFNKSSFEIADYLNRPIDEQIENAKNGEVPPELMQEMFDFGKYLFISSASGSECPNLQGIWNRIIEPPFACGYTLNINLQMNYWASEALNLSVLNDALFNLIDELCENGKKTAKIHYNKKGSCIHHVTDLFRATCAAPAPTQCAFWPMAGGWLARHLWEHYEYTQDIEFLRGRTYENIYAFAEFFADWIIEEDGNIKTIPSTSPENRFLTESGNSVGVCESTTMDLSIILDTFNIFKKVSEILGKKSELLERVKDLIPKINPFRIGSDGRLLEWGEEFPEAEQGHRHFSHLYALYPSDLIKDKDIESAARRSIEARMSSGGAYTGWSAAWLLCLYARLKEPDIAEKYLKYFFKNSVYNNLLTAHPPFQIDANFGFLAAVSEMLIQSHNNEIVLLPTIPKLWESGKISGFRARGNILVDLTWEKGKITKYSLHGENISIEEKGEFEFGKTIRL